MKYVECSSIYEQNTNLQQKFSFQWLHEFKLILNSMKTQKCMYIRSAASKKHSLLYVLRSLISICLFFLGWCCIFSDVFGLGINENYGSFILFHIFSIYFQTIHILKKGTRWSTVFVRMLLVLTDSSKCMNTDFFVNDSPKCIINILGFFRAIRVCTCNGRITVTHTALTHLTLLY